MTTRFCGSRDILKVHKIKAKHWSALCQQVVSLQALMLSLDRCIMTSYYSSNWPLDNHACCKLWRKLLYKRRPPNHSPRSSCDIQECIAHEARMFFYGRMSCRSICPVCMLYLHSLSIKWLMRSVRSCGYLFDAFEIRSLKRSSLSIAELFQKFIKALRQVCLIPSLYHIPLIIFFTLPHNFYCTTSFPSFSNLKT